MADELRMAAGAMRAGRWQVGRRYFSRDAHQSGPHRRPDRPTRAFPPVDREPARSELSRQRLATAAETNWKKR